jgi:peptidoglycan-associated lipoprotein
MTNLIKKLVLPALLVAALIATSGCASKKKEENLTSGTGAEQVQNVGDQGIDFDLNADSDSGSTGPIKTVYFEFDSARLSSDMRAILDTNAELLKKFPMLEIQVEGHCDERGGIQYNLALGERRAASVKDYLVAMGVESRRVTTISFGKERPKAFGHSEDAWSQNRRANFVITAK